MSLQQALDKKFEKYTYVPSSTPTFDEFVEEMVANQEFKTPVGNYEMCDLMEDLDFSRFQHAHDLIQMDALLSDPSTTMIKAAQKWLNLCELMRKSAKASYIAKIVPDYIEGNDYA